QLPGLRRRHRLDSLHSRGSARTESRNRREQFAQLGGASLAEGAIGAVAFPGHAPEYRLSFPDPIGIVAGQIKEHEERYLFVTERRAEAYELALFFLAGVADVDHARGFFVFPQRQAQDFGDLRFAGLARKPLHGLAQDPRIRVPLTCPAFVPPAEI